MMLSIASGRSPIRIVTGDDLLKGVRGKRVDARKVSDRDAVVLLELAFFFLNGDAGPVADELVRAGQRVEQCGLTAVRVARKGNFDVLFFSIYLHAFPVGKITVRIIPLRSFVSALRRESS